MPLTPADFALSEETASRSSSASSPAPTPTPCRSHEYVDAGAAPTRAGKTPFIWSTDDEQAADQARGRRSTVVQLVEERRKYWRTLQYLGGSSTSSKLDAEHRVELEALQQQYQESVTRARSLARHDRPRA